MKMFSATRSMVGAQSKMIRSYSRLSGFTVLANRRLERFELENSRWRCR